jgi:hypothetical protein
VRSSREGEEREVEERRGVRSEEQQGGEGEERERPV